MKHVSYSEIKLWHECQELIQDDDLWNGSRFFNNLEREILDIFGIKMERKGAVDYKSSSIFLNRNESDLMNFFN